MPQIVLAAVQFIAVNLARIGISKGIAMFVAHFVVNMAVSAAVSAAMRALSPKPPGGSMDQGQEIRTKVDAAYPREVAVGKFATGGSLAFENVSGTNNEYYWRVIPLSDDEINQITKVRGSGKDLTFSGDIHTGLRACTSHYQAADGTDCLYVRVYKGTESQTADSDLTAAFPSILDSNFRGRGVAYAIVRCKYDPDAFQGGIDLVFVGEGALLFDPRADTTAYSANLALITRAFLRGFTNNSIRVVGMGCIDDDVPEAEMEDAADICDEDVALGGGGTEDRYRGGGMISARETPREVLTNLCAGMAAAHIDRGGEIVILPGAARASVLPPITMTGKYHPLADAPISYTGKVTADELCNTVVSTCVDPTSFLEAALPVRKSAARIADEGDRFEQSYAYRYVNSLTQGQRLDQIALNKAGYQGRLSLTLGLWALELEPGDWQYFNLPHWGGGLKLFEIETMGLAIGGDPTNPSARVALSAREVDPSIYTWSTSDEIANAVAANTQPAPRASRTDWLGRLNGASAGGVSLITGAGLQRNANPLTGTDRAGAGTGANINIAAFTYNTSDPNGALLAISYNSGAVNAVNSAATYHVFAYDPTMAGGAVSYVAQLTNATTYIGNSNYVYIGTITTPADGAGGTGGSDDCVAGAAWLEEDLRACEAKPGDLIDALLEDGSFAPTPIEAIEHSFARCVRLIAQSGAALTCARSTPITQPDGAVILAPDAAGAQIAVIDDVAGFRWEEIAAVEEIEGPVAVAHIHVGGRTYAAGDRRGFRLFTHNSVKP